MRTVDHRGLHVVVTAGPTEEPLDAVRFLGNRSSGRTGIALADEAARRGWAVTLLLGPTPRLPADSRVRVIRFRTTEELGDLLETRLPGADVLLMAAAVADYRPRVDPVLMRGKRRREEGEGWTLSLEPTPDLLERCARRRRPGQVLVGFALEPREEMEASARAKMTRKGVDAIVANPLETLDASHIEAVLLTRRGLEQRTPGLLRKEEFARWLLDALTPLLAGGEA